MLNILQLKKVSRETVKEKLCNIVDTLNEHNFDKLKNKLNKMGVFNDVRTV